VSLFNTLVHVGERGEVLLRLPPFAQMKGKLSLCTTWSVPLSPPARGSILTVWCVLVDVQLVDVTRTQPV